MLVNWEGSPPFGRRRTLIDTLNKLAARAVDGQSQCIVEVGTSEAFSPNGLGNAMLAFVWYGKHIEARVHAVDIREGAVRNCGAIIAEHAPECRGLAEFHRMDAFEYAANTLNPHHHDYLPKIDLVYYDGPSEPYSWYVELHQRWAVKFQEGAFALFDDTDGRCNYAGKGGALIPLLLTQGWRQVQVDGEPVFPMVLLEKM